MLERFQLRKELHLGPDGEIWQARERDTRQTVVARIVDAAGIDRARREASALRSIESHPGVVRFVEDGPAGDGWCVVTEHVDGASLAKVLRITSPPPPRAIGWARQLCAALAACHAAGVVHGDLHPGNVILSRDAVGRDKLVLMGFQHAFHADTFAPPGFLGTAAPERMGAGTAGVRADQYAVGALLYRLLVERYPFTDDDVRAGRVAEPPALGHHVPGLRLPPGLEAIVFRCLERLPEARFASVAELGDRLAAVEYLPQRDWVRATGLDLTLAPTDRDPVPVYTPFVLGSRWMVAIAMVAAASLLGALWLAMAVP